MKTKKNKSRCKFFWILSLILKNIFLMFFLTIAFSGCKSQIKVKEQEKPRIIVTCDPEEDDQNSLIRFLLYSTDFKIDGLIYNESEHHWKGDGKGTKRLPNPGQTTRVGVERELVESWRWPENEDFIHETVEDYEKVYSNLKMHNPDYPTPEYLKSVIRWGNVEFEGDISKDTPGSDLIKEAILDDVPGTLFITAWGGNSSIARALKSIEEEYSNTPEWENIYKKVSEKVVLCLSGDQDGCYANYTGPNWPDIQRLQNSGGNISLAYNSVANVKPEYAFYYEPEWTGENISGKGPLGSRYRVWGDGYQWIKNDHFGYYFYSGLTEEELKKMGYIVWTPIHPKGAFLGEGDTGTILNFINNGLRAWENQTWGGWAGRKNLNEKPVDFAALMADSAAMAEFMRQRRHSSTDFPDFLPAAQNGFAARLQWSVTPNYEDANHDPVIEGISTISAKPGETVTIKTKVSDSDGDNVSVKWHQFVVDPFEGKVSVDNPDSPITTLVIPENAQSGDNIHIVLEGVDNGSPALTRYHRVIISIR